MTDLRITDERKQPLKMALRELSHINTSFQDTLGLLFFVSAKKSFLLENLEIFLIILWQVRGHFNYMVVQAPFNLFDD